VDSDTRVLIGMLFFIVPTVLLALGFWVQRRRGKIGSNWGAVLLVILCWVVGMMLVMRKLDQFL
jgi:FtsH-binding integral membrane protein